MAPGSSLVISIEGPIDACDTALNDRGTGDPERYIEVILREAVGNKQASNRLGQHRPNLVAVNYLLSAEAQAAFSMRRVQAALDLGENLDGLAMAAAGIDARLSRSDLVLVAARTPQIPVLELVATPL